MNLGVPTSLPAPHARRATADTRTRCRYAGGSYCETRRMVAYREPPWAGGSTAIESV